MKENRFLTSLLYIFLSISVTNYESYGQRRSTAVALLLQLLLLLIHLHLQNLLIFMTTTLNVYN